VSPLAALLVLLAYAAAGHAGTELLTEGAYLRAQHRFNGGAMPPRMTVAEVTGHVLPTKVEKLIEDEAAKLYLTEPMGELLRKSWIRGAVAGWDDRAKAISDSPSAVAQRAGWAFGYGLRQLMAA
jgi:hypothetical protein